MATIAPVTAEQLLEIAPRDGRCELVAGELRMMSPSGWKHGAVVSRVHHLLSSHVYDNQLGQLFGAETGFWISRDPDTVRAPDVAFIATENLPATEPKEAFWPGPPDLAVEVLSPGDKTGEVDEKIHAWLSAGTKLVWIVDPKVQTVTVYRSTTDVTVLVGTDELGGGNVLRGIRCRVADIFAVG